MPTTHRIENRSKCNGRGRFFRDIRCLPTTGPDGLFAERPVRAVDLKIVVDLQCQIDIVKEVAMSMMHDQRTRTISSYDFIHVGGEH